MPHFSCYLSICWLYPLFLPTARWRKTPNLTVHVGKTRQHLSFQGLLLARSYFYELKRSLRAFHILEWYVCAWIGWMWNKLYLILFMEDLICFQELSSYTSQALYHSCFHSIWFPSSPQTMCCALYFFLLALSLPFSKTNYFWR